VAGRNVPEGGSDHRIASKALVIALDVKMTNEREPFRHEFLKTQYPGDLAM